MADIFTASDIELMQKIAQSDSKALEALYNRYSSIFYTLIKKIVTDEKAAEEIFCDVFVIIWRKIKMYNLTSRNVYTWLITLTRNKAIDYRRRERNPEVMPEYTDEYEDKYIIPNLSNLADEIDIETAMKVKNSVEKALNKLTDAQQYVIYLAYYEGLTEKEIAERLNIPLPTVKQKVKFALSNLKENLIKGGE